MVTVLHASEVSHEKKICKLITFKENGLTLTIFKEQKSVTLILLFLSQHEKIKAFCQAKQGQEQQLRLLKGSKIYNKIFEEERIFYKEGPQTEVGRLHSACEVKLQTRPIIVTPSYFIISF